MITQHRVLQRGFTVVEMLLGISLFGILIPTIIIGLTSISTLNDAAKDVAIANIYAENKIEELRSLGYNSVATGTTSLTGSLPATLGISRSGSYTVTNATAGQKEITLTITITGRQSNSRTFNYRTVISEQGVGQ